MHQHPSAAHSHRIFHPAIFWPRVLRVFACPPFTVPWTALADVPLYVAAVMLCMTVVPASSFGRAL